MGREFLHVFEQWASEYDNTVTGSDPEYREVFKGYDTLLEMVSEKTIGNVVEFGPGTGNLTMKLLEKGCTVLAVEPSEPMRKLAEAKIKSDKVRFIDGDFFQFPTDMKIDTFVSTYAFHHLQDTEKEEAVKQYSNLLRKGGKIVFADTMFLNLNAYKETIANAKSNGFNRLAKDLQTEYYTTIPFIKGVLERNGFKVHLEQFNAFVWILNAVKL